MREFATRVSEELNLKMGVFGKKHDRYCLTEWNDVYGFSWIDINIAPYDKEQEKNNMSREVFGGGDWHSLEDCDEETQAMVKDARENNLPLVWVELAIRDMRHKVHCCRYIIRPLSVLSEAWVFDGVKEWLDEQRANRPEKEAKTINMINRMGYDSVECDLDGDCIVVGIKGKYGLITMHGEPLCELKYDSIAAVKKGELMSVKIDGKYGYINLKGEEIVYPKYDCAYCFKEGLAKVQIADKWGYINCRGEEIVSVIYDEVSEFINDCAPVCLNGKWGVITIDGKEIIPFMYDKIMEFVNGYAPVCLNGKWGFVTLDEKVVIPFEYDEVGEFGCGLANVKKGNKWGYINEQNELVIACKYDWAGTFNGGSAQVELDGEFASIGTDGEPYNDWNSFFFDN